MKESATKFNDFMVSKLAEEIGELRKDRKQHNESLAKLEKFVVQALAEEITEFAIGYAYIGRIYISIDLPGNFSMWHLDFSEFVSYKH
jgi:hypothetical protein